MNIQNNIEHGLFARKINNSNTKEYSLYKSMKNRCYYNKIYKNINIDDRFLDFQFFAFWCNNQIGFAKDNYQLDKDILIDGNNSYSPETCVFIPRELNNIIIRKHIRSEYPCGIRYSPDRKKYRSEISIDNKKYTKDFINEDDALNYYIELKLINIHKKAEKFKDKIDNRVYEKLISYNFESLKLISLKNKFQ